MMQLPPITVYRFNFYLKAEEPLYLPEFKGSLFRGAFGITFRRIVCITKQQSCTGCMLQQQCSYFKIFETEMHPNNLAYLKGVKKVPHPFVIMPPPESTRSYEKGAVLQVGLTLFGEAVNYLPFFVYTFKQMGETGISFKRSKVSLLKVTNASADNIETEVYNAATGALSMQFSPIIVNGQAEENPQMESVTIDFLTPVRLQERGEVLWKPEQVTVSLLMDTLHRRYLSTAYLFCDAKAENIHVPKQEYPDVTIAGNTLRFQQIDRYSNRQERKVPMDGFRGSIALSGNIAQVLPLLKAGSLLHIGKNTVFGMGRFALIHNSGYEDKD